MIPSLRPRPARPESRLSRFFRQPGNLLLILFAIEGVFFQFINSVNSFGNTLYATNLGATDTQIGLIQTIPNLAAIVLLLPVGIISDRARSTKTMPSVLLAVMGFSYLLFGTVPDMGAYRMGFYFLSLGLCVGVLANYNAQWQIMFGSVTPAADRNDVYTLRNRFMFFTGTVTPLVCSMAMSTMSGPEGKLSALRIFYYLSGIFLFMQAFLIRKLPGGEKSDEELAAVPPFRPQNIATALRFMFTDRHFRFFFLCVIVFYLTWHLDWSMWYLAEVKYLGMTEMHLGYFSSLLCVTQLFTIGIFARMNQKRSVDYTILYPMAGLCLCPVAILVCLPLPLSIRPWAFIVAALIASFPQCCIGLCTIQMLLDALPAQNPSLITSLYTIAITLSNSLLPLLGVHLYTALGADRGALVIFSLIVLALRIMAFLLFLYRYRRQKREAAPEEDVSPQAAPEEDAPAEEANA